MWVKEKYTVFGVRNWGDGGTSYWLRESTQRMGLRKKLRSLVWSVLSPRFLADIK